MTTHPLPFRSRPTHLQPVPAAALVSCEDEPVRSLVVELGAAEPRLLEHGLRVGWLAVALAVRVGVRGPCLESLHHAAILHDTGKRFISRGILDKPGPLAPHERVHVETHAAIGAGLLEKAGLEAEAKIVRHHHERWDGSGYPSRLAGGDIPFESRILLVADTYDAMISNRPYRPALAPHTALAEVEIAAGAQLDPRIAFELRAVLAQERER